MNGKKAHPSSSPRMIAFGMFWIGWSAATVFIVVMKYLGLV